MFSATRLAPLARPAWRYSLRRAVPAARGITTESATSSSSTSSSPLASSSFSHSIPPTSSSSAASSPVSTTSTSTSPFSSPSSTSPPNNTLSYFVQRTASQQLPVYQSTKSHGNRLLTKVQKVSGRVEDLKRDLQAALNLGADQIIINPVNRHIVIRGWRKQDVAKFLTEKQF